MLVELCPCTAGSRAASLQAGLFEFRQLPELVRQHRGSFAALWTHRELGQADDLAWPSNSGGSRDAAASKAFAAALGLRWRVGCGGCSFERELDGLGLKACLADPARPRCWCCTGVRRRATASPLISSGVAAPGPPSGGPGWRERGRWQKAGRPWWLCLARRSNEPDCHGIKNNGFTALADGVMAFFDHRSGPCKRPGVGLRP